MRICLRKLLFQLTLIAFLAGTVLPFHALYGAQFEGMDKAALEALYGEKLFICTENGFEWITLAELPEDSHLPPMKTGFECALCFVSAQGAKTAQLPPIELVLGLYPPQALRLHFQHTAPHFSTVDGKAHAPRGPPFFLA